MAISQEMRVETGHSFIDLDEDAPDDASSPSVPEPPAARKIGPGSILWLNRRAVAIYKMAVPEKGYTVVLVPGPHGMLKTQGLELQNYQVEEIGLLTPKYFDKLQLEMRWNRDLIIFHCYSVEDAEKVQLPNCEVCPHFEEKAKAEAAHAAAPKAAAPHPPAAPDRSLRRGQRLQIMMGGKSWNAVYWGKDDGGHVVAHNTVGAWALMRFNLDQYAATMRVEPEPDAELLRQIEAALPRE